VNAVIYRGYFIEKRKAGYVVSLKEGGRAETSQPSIEFAQKWVDQELKKQRGAK
jgi:hypothetical protein